MLKINYDVGLSYEPYYKNRMVDIQIDNAFLVQKGNALHLRIPNHIDEYWEWWSSNLSIQHLAVRHQSLLRHKTNNLLFARPVAPDRVVMEKDFYVSYAQKLFSSFRSGLALAEMIIKLQGTLTGSEWADLPDVFGAALDVDFKGSFLTCTIEPTHVTVEPILPPYHNKWAKRYYVKTWKPVDSANYTAIWHLFVTLSNGEKYKMYYPISSLNQWQESVQHYFEANPLEIMSPNVICHVTNHPDSYRYETIMERLKSYQEATHGISASEILIKLSAFLFFPERAVHLQKILTGKEVELVFSGNVHWY